uniref:Uncharacterized protein n=1 Tax=Chromera velia CCMP2878 TaxID=1169474 RepID=A0A0G4HI32_9ALVE|eukprot:Cvel_6905.t1-p1 / transcript=Cvel_6905.t1 / gene=Cvel_6905 / organism=Chromera_velia_CCMP2878 / gene_product=hypothetical protein / transcript_product=hypothetical protein / location=Cvel_scaffold349:51081-51941(+) / protein_length=152 / sequence_SO=supercontig / SO=protein_coding / is_pseudo=false
MVIVESKHKHPEGKTIDEARLPPERPVESPRGTRKPSLEIIRCTLREAEMNHILQTFADSDPPSLRSHLESQDEKKIRMRTVWFGNFTKKIGEDASLVALCPNEPRFTCLRGFTARWLLASFGELHLLVLRLHGPESYPPTEGGEGRAPSPV